jgi:hypothetical protein
MPTPNYDLSDARINSQIRVKALLETYRPNKAHFSAYQIVDGDLGWTIYNRVLGIEYIHKVDHQPDILYKATICKDIDKCFLAPKEIKSIVDWFTKEVVLNNMHTRNVTYIKPPTQKKKIHQVP